MPNRWLATIDVAEISGRDTRTVKKLAEERDIRPRKGKKNSLMWPCPEIFEALFALPERKGYEYERERLTKAQADKTELEAEVLRGRLIPREEVVDGMGRLVSAFRARIQGIGTALAPRVVVMTEAEAQACINAAHREALHELAAGSWAGGGPGAGTDGEPVGGHESEVEPRGKRRARTVEH